jgi:Na+/H+ antiporter NhaD/arsenite permease-like protein
VAVPASAHAGGPEVAGIPLEFVLFGLTLACVALFHHHTLRVALIGLSAVTAYKLVFTGFSAGPGLAGLAGHLLHEWVILANLLGLLLGFALLSRHFEDSGLPRVLPKYLPDDWKGAFVLLWMVFALSAFLDNIAAALIGGAIAHTVFRGRVHIGFLAGIVAAANAGGAGSVLGDTTTTMMWIGGVDPLDVLHAYVAAATALLVCGIPAALQQHRHSPIVKDAPVGAHIDPLRLGVVVFILLTALLVNLAINTRFSAWADRFPFLGAAVWAAILISVPLRRPAWQVLPEASRGAVFLLSLVTMASMMPVERLPAASALTAFGLGFVSAVFDNIPLTALALKQGGYDWGMLAYAVGFGGSMIWCGSSAGVALSALYPQARSVSAWLRHGWHVAVAYVIGFAVLLAALGWQPQEPHRAAPPAAAPASATP